MIAMLRILSMECVRGLTNAGITDPATGGARNISRTTLSVNSEALLLEKQERRAICMARRQVSSTQSLLGQRTTHGRLGIDEAVAIRWRVTIAKLVPERAREGAASTRRSTEGHSITR